MTDGDATQQRAADAAGVNEPSSNEPSSNEPSGARAVLVYNLSRLALLVACLVIGWFAGLRGAVWIVAAFLVSGVLSWFLLAKQRVGMGMAIERTVERGRARMAERTAAEDAYADSVHPADDTTT